ncbi:MAG: SBBP repeat-containing protein [Pyrinomonadaceae bacterium]
MLPVLNLRASLVYGLICSLLVTGLITFTTRQSHASHNPLPSSLSGAFNEPAEETTPQARTVDEATRSQVSEAFSKLPLSFEENRGQVDKEVKYLARGSGYTLFLTPTEAVLALSRSDGKKATTNADARRPHVPARHHRVRTGVVRMKLGGANRAPAITGESKMGVRTNYFKGNDPEKWQTDVARYERVRYEQVYPGIDMIYHGEQQQLEYDFEVAPGADPRQIALEYRGVKRVKIERRTGDLVLETTGGEVRQHKPVAYQEEGGERHEVASRYVMQGKRKVGIEVGEYDRTKRLVIDPVLSYSTYLGGSGLDIGYGIAVDASGYVYVTGYTESADFPMKNQYQIFHDDADAFVTKLNPNLSGAASLLYSTHLGGSSGSVTSGQDIAVDASGHAYVTGYTYSPDFPTLHQYQTYQGGTDVFVTELDTNASGAASLLYSTYLGGTRDSSVDSGNGIAVGASGYVYVTGVTDFDSRNFPTLNPYQAQQRGTDAFVAKLDTKASGAASLLYSTFLGGSLEDVGTDIAVDASGNAYVTGYTSSTNFPTLHRYHAYQGGAYDAFVTKLNPSLSGAASLLYSTFLGGDSEDVGNGIAVDASSNAYVTGSTFSSDFPTKNEYQVYPYRLSAFVTKLNTSASGAASLLYSTYLASTNEGGLEEGRSIAVDSSGIAYVAGRTESAGFPTLHQYQTYQGYTDLFVAKLDTNASGIDALLYGTYLGGNNTDEVYDIAIDSAGNAYVTGYTYSPNFPMFHQYQGRQDANNPDAFVTKLRNIYLISGHVTSDGTTGIGGVAISISGSQSATTVTDSDGHYSIALGVGGDYTLTPSKGSLNFSPSAQSFTNLLANQTNINFTTRPVNISGKVTVGTATGAGLAGVTITLTGGEGFDQRTVTTASDGTYSFSDVPVPRNYRITPSKTNYAFNLSQGFLSNVTTGQTNKNFIATLKTYTISGVVKHGSTRLAGVTVKLTSPTPAGFTARTATTNSAGAYSFTGVPAGRSYTVTPTKIGYQFTPTNKLLPNLSANQTTVNFLVKVYSISGKASRSGSTAGIGTVTMTLTSPTPAGFSAHTAQTNATGVYTFTNLPAGRNYTIKPTKTGYTFSPATRSLTNLSNNILAGASTNFTGTGP